MAESSFQEMQSVFVDKMAELDMEFTDLDNAINYDVSLAGRVSVNWFDDRVLNMDMVNICVFFAHGPGVASDPDAFFAETRECNGEMPALLLYLSCDENVMGRCATVTAQMGTIAVTLIDARITIDAYLMIALFQDELVRFGRYGNKLLRCVKQGMPAIKDAVHDAIEDGTCIVMTRVKRTLVDIVGSFGQYDKDRGGTQTRGASPDIACLLAHARGPITCITTPHCTEVKISTIIGGDVAVIIADSPQVTDQLISSVHELQTSRVIFLVFQNTERGVEEPSHVSAWLNDERPTLRLIVSVYSVPATHVAHVIDEAVTLALACRSGYLEYYERWRHLSSLQNLLSHPCDRATHSRAIGARVKIMHLRYSMSRSVDANLNHIKARLWAPDGRLCQRFMESVVLK